MLSHEKTQHQSEERKKKRYIVVESVVTEFEIYVSFTCSVARLGRLTHSVAMHALQQIHEPSNRIQNRSFSFSINGNALMHFDTLETVLLVDFLLVR